MNGQSLFRRPYVPVAGWMLFVLATNAWLGFSRTARDVSDIGAYEQIAKAAPGFPDVALESQHAERFVVHWLIGTLSGQTGLTLTACYWAFAFGAAAALVAVSAAAIRLVSVQWQVQVVAVGVVAASVYPVRYGLAVPGQVADTLFAVGVGGTLLGLLRRRLSMTVVGLGIACLARPQSALPLGVVVAAAEFRSLGPTRAAAVALAPALFYIGIVMPTVAGFASTAGNGIMDATVLGAAADLPRVVGDIARQLVYVALGLALPLAAVFAAIIRRGRAQHSRAVAVSMGLAVVVALQPMALDPAWTGRAAIRLSALAVVPLTVAAAAMLQTREIVRTRWIVLGVAAIAAASARHFYSQAPGTALTDAILTALGAVGVFVACRKMRQSDEPGVLRAPSSPTFVR